MATPPTFVTGAILTAAQMNAVGLWLIKTQTIGSAVATVEVTGAFSADYDNYLIIVSGGVGSASTPLKLTLGSTATGYSYGIIYNVYGNATVLALTANNTTSWPYSGIATANAIDARINIRNPFDAKYTTMDSAYVGTATDQSQGTQNGFLANTTSYTAFTIAPTTGTLTGGTIRVYGYRD